MFERFTPDARMVVKAAETHARGLGSPTVEAEHLLLALTAADQVPGLDHDTLLEALETQRERSLRSIGITADDFAVPPAPVTRHPRFAASAKLALSRAVEVADRRIGATQVLLGVLEAEAGTVPRALDAAGIDADDLRAQVTDC